MLYLILPRKKFTNICGYLPVNSADSIEFTGTFTIPLLDNEYTNQARSLHIIFVQNIAVTLVGKK